MRIALSVSLFTLAFASHTAAQRCAQPNRIQRVDLTDTRAILARALQIRFPVRHQSGFARASIESESVCGDSIQALLGWADSTRRLVSPLPAALTAIRNSNYPRDRNDGTVWAGVGLNTTTEAGAQIKWRFLTATLYPAQTYSQNLDFEVPRSAFPDRSSFAHPYIREIDWPKRMGPDPLSRVDLGKSSIRADLGPFYASFSNENIWLGPMQIHPTLMSNTGPGVPHVRIGTARPVDLKIVRAEFLALYGQVTESDYFDGDLRQTHFYQTTMVALEPKGAPGLHLGVARTLHDTSRAFPQSLKFYLQSTAESPFWGETAARRLDNRHGALFVRWVLPESGFEVYLEWMREDFPLEPLNLFFIPDYASALGGGFQKTYTAPKRVTRLYAEMLSLGQGAPNRGGAHGVVRLYTHWGIPQGHTHRGQLLGAAIGPGSDAQTVGLDTFTPTSRTGLMLERVRYDTDTYYELFSRRFSESRYDLELTAEGRRMQKVGPLEVEGVLRFSRRYNRDFIEAENETDRNAENNLGAELALRWLPRF